ncbi:hypothetical protein [Variovorax saccharolyticus]|uniref:hypothetical protein n=1 Tax=Variovorax saccharolyticus TaxID=3053516 RepID=UPI002576BAFE|nr:hypothetical protein [Variovorax sp. J31P216]MDM0030363.1 hypothetical protein [Variovorax sp. J31P216]
MEAASHQRREGLKGWSRPSGVGCLALLLYFAGGPVLAADPSITGARPDGRPDDRPRVTAVEQVARDTERVRILRAEWTHTRQVADALARRRAERLAARDTAGVDEVDAQRARVLQDLDALEHELGAAQRPATRATQSTAPAPSSVGSSAAAPAAEAAEARTVRTVRPAPPTRWWDVYSRAAPPRAAPVSLAAPSGGEGPHPATPRRLE